MIVRDESFVTQIRVCEQKGMKKKKKTGVLVPDGFKTEDGIPLEDLTVNEKGNCLFYFSLSYF